MTRRLVFKHTVDGLFTRAYGGQIPAPLEAQFRDMGLYSPAVDAEVFGRAFQLVRDEVQSGVETARVPTCCRSRSPWGPRVKVVPVLPDTPEEERLLRALPGIRPAELVATTTEYRRASSVSEPEPPSLESWEPALVAAGGWVTSGRKLALGALPPWNELLLAM